MLRMPGEGTLNEHADSVSLGSPSRKAAEYQRSNTLAITQLRTLISIFFQMHTFVSIENENHDSKKGILYSHF
jgi:hypothetical protein